MARSIRRNQRICASQRVMQKMADAGVVGSPLDSRAFYRRGGNDDRGLRMRTALGSPLDSRFRGNDDLGRQRGLRMRTALGSPLDSRFRGNDGLGRRESLQTGGAFLLTTESNRYMISITQKSCAPEKRRV